MNHSYKFRKSERLTSQKEIQALFEDAWSFHSFPFRVVWRLSDKPEGQPAQIVISVPKKKFKRAVHRNLIRRRIKESYRLQKQVFYEYLNQESTRLVFMLMYTHDELLETKELEDKISSLILRFKKEVEANT